ncbi:MAG TPA: glycosyltransferase [Terriglobia bacterium]|nr:glycosyltransferase [Terriglobia bacterium]
MLSNRIVQGLWIGSRLTQMQRLSIASFLAHGHDYHLYAYLPIVGVPSGVILRDANEIIPASNVFRNRTEHTYAAFSDFFRYRLLLERGGWWVDADVVCLKPFDFDFEYVFSSEDPMDQPGADSPNCGVIKAPAGAPFLAYADAVCRSKNPGHLAWSEVGPELIAEAIAKFSLDRYVTPAATFCPVPWFRFTDLIDASFDVDLTRGIRAVHLWHEMWRCNGLDPDAAYTPGCLYERWKATYLPS